MADTKITLLPEETVPIGTDIVAIVDDPSGTPTNKKSTLTNLSKAIDHDQTINFSADEHFTMLDEDNMASNSATQTATQQSIKKYVDDKVVSSVDYQGGYNASTNSPDLDTSPSGVLKGDMYTVTAAGNFFATAVEIGDVLIAEADNATTEGEWTIVNKNLDASSIKTAYESNADTNAFTDAEKTLLGNQSGANTGDESSATDSAEGIVELATVAETTTGTDTGRAVTPDGLAGSIYGRKTMIIQVLAHDTALTTGDGKMIFTIPLDFNGMNLVDADAAVHTASSSGTPTVQIRNVTDTVDMLSTAITIDANEKSSYTAATAPVINAATDDVATGDEIAIDVDVAGTGTVGLDVILVFATP